MSPRQYAKLPQNSGSRVMSDCVSALERRRATLFFKRFFDVWIAVSLALLLLPLFLVIAVAVAIDSRGGVLFSQERVGRFGRPFRLLKFRSMTVCPSGSVLTSADDARVTRVGRILRPTHLDELPQLWNVIRGDMSLVGPRPEVARFVDVYTADQRATLLVRPGITCRSSIAFADESERYPEDADPETFYVETILPEKCAMNVQYVLHLSLWEDIKIAFATLFKK